MSEQATIDLRQAIERKARQLGFELFGVTTPDPPQHYRIFENWLAAGRHAEMAYLAGERSRLRRGNPRLILPECQSILVLGICYSSPGHAYDDQNKGERALWGRTAAYAWGEDYHEVIPDRLTQLVAVIEVLVGRPVAHRIYTDTGPLLERELAQRAGLGWIGKNTCLIHPQKGSFFLLAEVLLDLVLEPDQPFNAEHCGNCTRCLDACPTGCILPDRTIDAGRCISYLTIELKDSIPELLRSKLGEWVFGCDICQLVCPWNRAALNQVGDPSFKTRADLARPDLLEELGLSASEFNRKTRGSPLKRAKRRGYLRNVASALGCAGDRRAVPALANALFDQEPLVRAHSAWALGQITGNESEAALRAALRLEQDPLVQDEIHQAIQRCQLQSDT